MREPKRLSEIHDDLPSLKQADVGEDGRIRREELEKIIRPHAVGGKEG